MLRYQINRASNISNVCLHHIYTKWWQCICLCAAYCNKYKQMNGTHNVCCDWKNWPSSYCNAICLWDIINELNNSHLCIFTTNKETSIREEKYTHKTIKIIECFQKIQQKDEQRIQFIWHKHLNDTLYGEWIPHFIYTICFHNKN